MSGRSHSVHSNIRAKGLVWEMSEGAVSGGLLGAARGTWFARFDVSGLGAGGVGSVGGNGEDDGGNGPGDDGWGELDAQADQGSTYFEVVAWDAEGHALIVNVQAGCLRRANEVPGFTGLASAMEATAPSVSALDE
ncbi:hypothetical protein [Streptomyces erythrochromogenes]|uniref:hypothetical protein n=1 Tax=Streptomyces erythrochromogenes TaxID=285574 RepID=UPI0036CAE27C